MPDETVRARTANDAHSLERRTAQAVAEDHCPFCRGTARDREVRSLAGVLSFLLAVKFAALARGCAGIPPMTLGYYCKVERSYTDEACAHEHCLSDGLVRVDDDTLIAMATTCSNRELALHAEIRLRQRYPSKRVKVVKRRVSASFGGERGD